jgi:hypothetical protein
LRLATILVLAFGAVHANGALAQNRSSDAAGRYAIWRGEINTGCMLTLENRAVSGGLKAQLSPACRDSGLTIFDPQNWALDRGRLTLTARLGHKNHFERLPSGVWRRDGKEGKELSLRPL